MIQSSLGIITTVLLLILAVPLVCRKIHVPGIVGFILAGMVIGPLGCGLIGESPSIKVLGQMGMLYIMFQSGSEIDMNDFRQYKWAALRYGWNAFLLPAGLGVLTSIYILKMNWVAALLMGAMYGSHTLMTYPIVSRYGVQKQRSVNIVVGGTMLAITLSLLVLAGVKAQVSHVDVSGWWAITKLVLFVVMVVVVFPWMARWFLKRVQEPVANFMLVMALLVCSAWMGEIAGLEGILGAFICGVSLNRLLPNHSPLMSRITFVGNSIFVPMFLLSVGMIIDVQVFVSGWATLAIAATMIATKLLSKWLAAALTQWEMKFSNMERQLIFGMTHAAAAGTLAIVTIGYNIGVLNSEVLNAAVLMILILCTTSSFVTEHAAKQIALQEDTKIDADKRVDEWLVAGLQDNTEYLASLAESASLPQSEYMRANSWESIKQKVEMISKSVAVYHQIQPLNTIDRLLVAVPRYAEKERDFITCFGLVRRLSGEIGADVVFYANQDTQPAIQKMCNRPGKYLKAHIKEMDDWEDILEIKKDLRDNDMLVLLSSRRATASYNPLFEHIPDTLQRFFNQCNYLVVYPEQQTGGVDMDTFLMELPQPSKAWSVVTWSMNHLRHLQRR